jgi:class 3 adenylate cyclase
MVFYSVIATIESYCQEAVLRGGYQASLRMGFTLDRLQGTLDALMPPGVVDELRCSPASLAHSYQSVTLAQSDLAGFTRLAGTREPSEVVELISELFGRFDELTNRFEVYKVETVGDAYIAGQGGPPLTTKNSPVAVVCFASQLIEETARWSQDRGLDVGCRVGVHTAACVGGIVGSDMQRYHLFGELMTCLDLLEATSHVGKVHVSKDCKDAVDAELTRGSTVDPRFRLLARQEQSLLTSKGEAHPYVDVGGGPTYFVVE